MYESFTTKETVFEHANQVPFCYNKKSNVFFSVNFKTHACIELLRIPNQST